MKKNVIYILVVVIFAVTMCISLSACDKTEKCTITFDYNVGNLIFSMEQQQTTVEKNALISNYPDNGIDERKIDGYHIEGWYTASTDRNGNVLVDDNRFVKLQEKWDFENNRVDKDITLYANWVKNPPKQEVRCYMMLYYQITNSEKGCIRVSDSMARIFYVDEPITYYSYYEEIKNQFEYCEYEGIKYKVLFWYVPKIENRRIMFDENGFAIIDRIWDLQNDVITSDMSELVLFAKVEPVV